MISISDAITRAYNDDENGFGSIAKTLKDAKTINPNVTLDDVKKWFESNIGSKTQLKGYNSFIVNGAYKEYQIDLFFFQDLEKETNKKQPYAMICIDIFTKFLHVVPIKTKQPDDVLDGIKQCITTMQAKPDTIMSDEEGSFLSNKVQHYFKEEEIKHIVTRNHPAFAERAIRTIKQMIYRRVEAQSNPIWTDHIKRVLHNYNYKMIHSATGFTPDEARLARHRETIHTRLELKGKNNRKYPLIEVGAKVRIYKKKSKMDKERIGVWSKDLYTVESIKDEEYQKIYKLRNVDRPFVRSEILLVDTD